MRNYLGLIAASAVAGLGSGIGTANAEVVDQQKDNFHYYFKYLSMSYSDAANGNYTVNSHVEKSNVVDGFGTTGFNSKGIEVGIGTGEVYSTMDDSYTSVNLLSNTSALETRALNFDVDHLHANRQRLSFGGDTVSSSSSDAVNTAPEPETYTMLIVGFGMLGYSVRRRRRIGY